MSVKVEVPLSALSDPTVARSLAQLFEALGGVKGAALSAPSQVRPARSTTPRPEARQGPRPDAETRYAEFMEALPERSRQFLEMVRDRGVLGIEEAMQELDVKVGKAMGGITGSIARWAPEHDVTVPFEAIKGADGKRAWRWIGMDVEPAPPVPVRARRRRRRSGSSRSNSGASASEAARSGPSFEDRLASLKEALPDDSRRFLDLVEEQGEVEQSAVLNHFGLARAQGLRRILRPLDAEADRRDLGEVVQTVIAPTGERAWRWGGPREAARPAAPNRSVETSRPGVRVRKRRTASG